MGCGLGGPGEGKATAGNARTLSTVLGSRGPAVHRTLPTAPGSRGPAVHGHFGHSLGVCGSGTTADHCLSVSASAIHTQGGHCDGGPRFSEAFRMAESQLNAKHSHKAAGLGRDPHIQCPQRWPSPRPCPRQECRRAGPLPAKERLRQRMGRNMVGLQRGWDFPSAPVAKTPCSQFRGSRVQSLLRELDPIRCN